MFAAVSRIAALFSVELAAQFDFCLLQRPTPLSRQVLAGAVDIKRQHREC